jgi:uncharacterized membrane protein
VSGISKASIGVGAAIIFLGAVALWRYEGIWSTYIGYIVAGMFLILTGISPVLGGRNQKVIRGLRFGLAGVAIVFVVIGLVLLIRS